MNILIIDDNVLDLKVLKAVLTGAGHNVEVVSRGKEALAALQHGQSRVLIADWDMPEMTGLELCRTVRESGLSEYVYIILLTVRLNRQDKLAALAAGADDFMTKPFDQAELRLRLQGAERLLALETRQVTIFALAKLAESRDPETGTHLERVRNYTRMLAEALAKHPDTAGQINGEFIQTIYMTSPLHDIGKVGIPDRILLKPDRLNQSEFEMMKHHTSIGADTLYAAMQMQPQAAFLKMAWQISLCHHEKFDGTGYPAGTKGRDIPISGRIMAVADVYDALTSRRVYKSAFSHEVAMGIIQDEAGTHFDPIVVEALVKLQNEFLAVRREYADTGAQQAATAA